MLVAVFASETDAFKGIDALQHLNEAGDISIYATAILVKEPNGKVNVKQSAPEGPAGTAVGMLTGAVIGLLGGPAGSVVGASVGGMTGLLFDVGNAGVNADFLNDVSEVLIPGKSVIIAEIDEDWVSPVDREMVQLGGQVFRRPRSEVIEDQLARDSAVFNEEAKEIREELKDSRIENKAAAQKTLTSVKNRLKAVETKSKAQMEQIDKEANAKVNALHTQLKNAHEEKKEKLEKRIAKIKADQKTRNEKLRQARDLAHQALTA